MTAPRLSAGGMIAGKYTVRSMLGNGGATITYHCVSQSGQEVAVKLYDPWGDTSVSGGITGLRVTAPSIRVEP